MDPKVYETSSPEYASKSVWDIACIPLGVVVEPSSARLFNHDILSVGSCKTM